MTKLIPVTVKGLALDSRDSPVVLLEELEGKRILPIWIGVFEATSIQIAIDGITVDRPLTHDLLIAITSLLGAKIERVAIMDLTENTYFAQIHLLPSGEQNPRVLDARPSDALALAVRCNAQIVVAESVLERGHVRAEATSEEGIRKRLEEMSAEQMGKYTM